MNKLTNIINEVINQHLDDEIKNIMLNSDDIDGFIKAVSMKYGNKVPLFHATTVENSKIIDNEGFKLVNGRNYKSYANEEILYFQLGKSDYVSAMRPVLYRIDVTLDFISKYAYADVDSIKIISDDELNSLGVNPEYVSSDMLDMIKSFISNDMKLDGIELLIANRDNDIDIFQGIKPIKIIS